MFVDVFIEIQGQLIQWRHSSLDDVEDILGVFDQTFRPLKPFDPINNVQRFIEVKSDFFAYNF